MKIVNWIILGILWTAADLAIWGLIALVVIGVLIEACVELGRKARK